MEEFSLGLWKILAVGRATALGLDLRYIRNVYEGGWVKIYGESVEEPLISQMLDIEK